MAFLSQALSFLPATSIPPYKALGSINMLVAAASQTFSPVSQPEDNQGGLFSKLDNMMPNNLSIYWVFATSIACWFLFLHSPPFIIRRKVFQDFPLAAHMVGAYTIYLTCIFNTMFTPSSLHGKARPFHVWIGRIGMVMGLISFALGLFCAWWPYRQVRPPFAFSFGVTIGGLAQIAAQRRGYRAIRRFRTLKAEVEEKEKMGLKREELDELKQAKESALRNHIYNMVALFVAACGIPAGLRLSEFLPSSLEAVGLIVIIVSFQAVIKPFGDTYVTKSKTA